MLEIPIQQANPGALFLIIIFLVIGYRRYSRRKVERLNQRSQPNLSHKRRLPRN